MISVPEVDVASDAASNYPASPESYVGMKIVKLV